MAEEAVVAAVVALAGGPAGLDELGDDSGGGETSASRVSRATKVAKRGPSENASEIL